MYIDKHGIHSDGRPDRPYFSFNEEDFARCIDKQVKNKIYLQCVVLNHSDVNSEILDALDKARGGAQFYVTSISNEKILEIVRSRGGVGDICESIDIDVAPDKIFKTVYFMINPSEFGIAKEENDPNDNQAVS